MLVASYLPLCYNLIRINWEREKMLSAIYPVPASEVRLPFYLLGIGRTSPEFHVKRDKGLTSHQFLYTAKGCGILEVGNRKYKLEKNSFMYLPPELPHEYYPENDEWNTCWMIFRGDFLKGIMNTMGFIGEMVATDADLTAFKKYSTEYTVLRRIIFITAKNARC